MKHTRLIKKPSHKIVEVLKSKGREVSASTHDLVNRQCLYLTIIYNHRKFFIIEINGMLARIDLVGRTHTNIYTHSFKPGELEERAMQNEY